MAFQLSPGVQIQENDQTNVVPAVSSSIGAYAGYFLWGPVNEVRTITSENQLVSTFGRPGEDQQGTPVNNTVDFHSAANFLAYAGNLKVVRAVGTSARNAVGEGTAPKIDNDLDYDENHVSGSNSVGLWAAKYPGALGNSLLVGMIDVAGFTGWTYEGQFGVAPGTSDYAVALGNSAADDELHIIVVDEDGVITGTAGTVLEKFANVSKARDAKGSNGESIYYKDVINANSKYIYWMDHITTEGTSGTDFEATSGTVIAWGNTVPASGIAFSNMIDASGYEAVSLGSGIDDDPADGDLYASGSGYGLFTNKEEIEIDLVITGNHSTTVCQNVIDNVVLGRKDCVAFVSPELADVQNNAGSEADDVVSYFETLARYNSYTVADSGWKRQYDKYNDVYINVPLNPDVAGLCALTDRTNDAWWSPAGLNRGAIRNAVKLLYSPGQTDRDTLYVAGINPVVNLSGQGIVLFGDKTLLRKPSAFDRINVRRLFLILEKSLGTAAKFQLFEFNDAFTRSQFRSMVEPFLRTVQGRRGIYDFRVVCDESNNTGEVIDRNEFVADIYIKPARSINFIRLNFIATRTSVSFEELGA